ELASGLDPALDCAQPVSPVLVAELWALTSPESPEIAVGTTVTPTLPPAPPLASARAIDPPPTAPPVAAPPAAPVMALTDPPVPAAGRSRGAGGAGKGGWRREGRRPRRAGRACVGRRRLGADRPRVPGDRRRDQVDLHSPAVPAAGVGEGDRVPAHGPARGGA